MSAILAWLATYAVHSTLLLGGVAFLTTFVVRRDAWQDTLWKAALVGGLVTATVQLALGIRPLVGYVELPATVTAAISADPQAVADGPFASAGGGGHDERDGRAVGDAGARVSAAATDS